MGCGNGFYDLFREFEHMGHSDRGCEGGRHTHHHYDYDYDQQDMEETLILLKNMYASGLLEDEEYQYYRQAIYKREVRFEELSAIRRERYESTRQKANHSETKTNSPSDSKYRAKIIQLKNAKGKILAVQEKIHSNIADLEKEKKKMEDLAGTMLKSNEESAEKYINHKIDIEEHLQSLGRRNEELEGQLNTINRYIKELETKELELEALKLQEEIQNYSLNDNLK